jgi:tetratricopeptide (TPR) repeat protein
VVPVYDVGRFGDRPFFTMKLVKGHTLAQLLGGREQPAADRPRLLSILLQVCQAMAYAHAKGVIHRDLKPANVMVGAFGEVQVMDWGLAKVLAEGGVADEERASRLHQDDGTHIRTARGGGAGSGTDTEAGSLLGTPAYMPPEQAQGDVALLDRRADVFGLGAILCEVLTGRPPYVGRSLEEVRRKAANGDLADALARLGGCGADPELIALTRRCLSAEAADRPKDAREVAGGLSGYLDGVQERLQAAQRERAVALAREAEQAKRRRVQLALAAAVVLLLAGGGAFAFWRNEQAQAGRERDARNAEAVAALLSQCEEALHAGDAAKAAVSLEAARKRSAEGGAGKEAARLGRLEADLALLRDLDAVDQFRWTVVDNKLPDPAAVAARTREALRRFGADPDAAPAEEAAARVSASAVSERVVPALDRLLWQERSAGARAVLRRVDADPYRDAVRDAALAGDRAKVAALAGQEAALGQPPGFAAFLGESGAIGVERRLLLGAAVGRRPGDLALLMALGNSCPKAQEGWFQAAVTKGQEDGVNEWLRWFQAAVAAAPGNAAAHNSLGVALADNGKVDEAIACYRKAIEIDPKYAIAHSNLGNALGVKGQVAEAIACHKKAIEVDPKNAGAHNNLGNALAGKGKVEEAIACYQKAIELRPKLALAHGNLGAALRGKGQVDEAIACFKKAIEIDPKYAVAHSNLGNALRVKGQVDEAIACFKKAIEIDPKYAGAHNNLGNALARKGQVGEAIACYQKAIEVDPKYAPAHNNLGDALRGKGQVEEAIACFKKAIEVDPKLAEAHNNLGFALDQVGKQKEAIEAWRSAVRLNPRLGDTQYWLGKALLLQGRPREALAPLGEAAKLLPAGTARDRNLHYDAARSAALAAAGQGKGAAKLDGAERARLRKQASDWLRADLVLRSRQLQTGKPADRAAVQQALRHWQQDSDLAGIRDKAALDKLPAEEQKAFAQLWADVGVTLRKAEKGTK